MKTLAFLAACLETALLIYSPLCFMGAVLCLLPQDWMACGVLLACGMLGMLLVVPVFHLEEKLSEFAETLAEMSREFDSLFPAPDQPLLFR